LFRISIFGFRIYYLERRTRCPFTSIDVENAGKFLRRSKRSMREENLWNVPIVADRSLKRFFPVFLLRRVKRRLLPVVPLVDLRDLPEANEYRWSTGYNLSRCKHLSITLLDTINSCANQLATYCRVAGSRCRPVRITVAKHRELCARLSCSLKFRLT
jgi:hypothetical protein